MVFATSFITSCIYPPPSINYGVSPRFTSNLHTEDPEYQPSGGSALSICVPSLISF